MAVQLGNKNIGDVIKINVGGSAREFIVVHKGKPSSIYDDSYNNGVIVLMKDIYESRQWHGSNVNDYANSAIHAWLNNEFLNLIASNIRDQIKQVRVPHRPGDGLSMTVNSGANGFPSKIFLLSYHEAANSPHGYAPTDGSVLSYFANESGTSNSALRVANLNGTGTQWWLRTPRAEGDSTTGWVWLVSGNGNTGRNVAANPTTGIRPAFVLPSTLYADDGGSVIIIQPPTTPSSLTVPETITGGSSAAISWGTATDPQSQSLTYILERAINGGSSWSQLYSGSSRSYTDSVAAGTTSVQYRVKARNTSGLESSYRTGSTINVITIQPPAMPATLNVPATIIGGSDAAISWSAATDPQSEPVSYILERATNGGAFSQIYSGSALSHSDSVAAGTNTVQYRVRARNTSGYESANNTGNTINVLNNSPPVIDGADGSLGVKSAAFAQNYIVTDPNAGDTLTVTERMNGVQLRQYIAANGAQQTFSISADDFVKMGGGTQTLQVTATDQHGASATRTWTFSRDTAQTSQIQVEFETPLPADAQPKKIVASVVREIPEGATFKVEACNNGHDASPAWEDCTAAVLLGIIYTFKNTAKTAANWGVNVRASVQRNGADGDCWVSSIGGNYE